MPTDRRSLFRTARVFLIAALAVSLASPSLAQPPGGRGRGGGFGNPTGEMPVPPVVAMARPSQEELARARELFDQFSGSLSAADRGLLERYPRMLQVTTPVNTAIVPNLAAFFRDKHAANVEIARAGEAELLFMGDSITDFWRNETGAFAGKPVQDEYFSQWNIANFGIAGDTTQGVLYRLQNGEGTGFSPRAVMLMIGTNNTGRNTGPEIAEGVGAVVLELQTRFPDAKILLLGIFPRATADNPVRATLAQINDSISRLHDGEKVFYMDIGQVFLDADGNIPAEVMSDALHPSTEGYRRWAEAVKDPLARLMAE